MSSGRSFYENRSRSHFQRSIAGNVDAAWANDTIDSVAHECQLLIFRIFQAWALSDGRSGHWAAICVMRRQIFDVCI
jgi:hypothetical protein